MGISEEGGGPENMGARRPERGGLGGPWKIGGKPGGPVEYWREAGRTLAGGRGGPVEYRRQMEGVRTICVAGRGGPRRGIE